MLSVWMAAYNGEHPEDKRRFKAKTPVLGHVVKRQGRRLGSKR